MTSSSSSSAVVTACSTAPTTAPTTAPATPPPTTPTFTHIIYNPSLHAITPSHITNFRDLINPAYMAISFHFFNKNRIPDEEAAELVLPGRWVHALYIPSPSSPPLLVTDHLSVQHSLAGLELAGTISVSHTPEKREWHLHLLATRLGLWKAGVGAKLLAIAEEFARSRGESGEEVVLDTVVEFGNAAYYHRRGFKEVGERTYYEKGMWESKGPFSTARMVRVL